MFSKLNFNGEIISSETLVFNFQHSLFQTGEILVEKVRLLNQEFLFPERHYFHLMAQMRMARIEIPMNYTPGFFYNELEKLKEVSGYQNAEFQFYVSRNESQVDFWIRAEEQTETFHFQEDYQIDLYRETYVSGDLHQRLNFLNPRLNILKIYAEENQLDDLILLNFSKSVAHSMRGNIFAIQDNQVFTSSLEQGALDDVLRDRVIQACVRTPEISDIQELEEFFPFKLTHAEEIFIAQNGKGIVQVSKMRKKNYSKELSERIVETLLELV